MELSHALSDAVLTLTGFFVFFRYLLRLKSAVCLSWSTFILSVALAAFFGTLRFLGVSPYAVKISEFFQHSAGTVGAFGLILASLFLVLRKPLPQFLTYAILALGVIVLCWIRLTGNLELLNTILTVSIPMVFLAGLWSFFKGARLAAIWLIMAVLVLIAGTFNKSLLANDIIDSINIYHYLLAISLLCFGKAAQQQNY